VARPQILRLGSRKESEVDWDHERKDWDSEPERKVKARIAEKQKALQEAGECPTGYTGLEARKDRKRVDTLLWRYHKVTAAEDAELAHL
jgi:hypothetical protein